MNTNRERPTHFGSFDDRFCGTSEECRRFSPDPNDVDCKDCQHNDRLTLTAQGEAYLRALNEKVT